MEEIKTEREVEEKNNNLGIRKRIIQSPQQYLNRKHNDRIQLVYLIKCDLHELN